MLQYSMVRESVHNQSVGTSLWKVVRLFFNLFQPQFISYKFQAYLSDLVLMASFITSHL